MTTFTVTVVKQSFDWGCVCTLASNGNHFREERKMAWDRLGAPKMLRRVIDLKPGDIVEATLLRSRPTVGDILSLADVEAQTSLWSEWQ
jgi:hypothetical protein